MPRLKPILGLIVAIVLFGAVVYPLYLIYSIRGVVPLEELWAQSKPWNEKDIQFAKTSDGKLLFFSGSTRDQLAALVQDKIPDLEILTVVFDPAKRERRAVTMNASMTQNGLGIGPYLVPTKEILRLRLDATWDKALKWLANSPFAAGKSHWDLNLMHMHNITLDHVKDNQFLISGGDFDSAHKLGDETVWSKYLEFVSSAKIVDVEKGAVIKIIPLKVLRYGHASIQFPDGKILLLGGQTMIKEAGETETRRWSRHYTSNPSNAELIDLQSGTTKLFPCNLTKPMCYCFDDQGNCIWVESSDEGNIFNINPSKGSINRVGKLEQFNSSSRNSVVPQNATMLDKDRLLVCGGSVKRTFGYPIGKAMAEIVVISQNEASK